MSQRLLSIAQEQAEQSAKPVRAAALLRIARVWTAFDQDEAIKALERGISSMQELSEPDRSIILREAISLAATVSPERAIQLASSQPTSSSGPHTSEGTDRMIYNMLHHGRKAEAIDYLIRNDFGKGYPFVAAHEAMNSVRNEEGERSILRAAMKGWLESLQRERHESMFMTTFELRWKILPEAEVLEFLRAAVTLITSEQDRRTNASYGGRIGVETLSFTSLRQSRLFRLVGPLNQLAPELISSLKREYPQFAVAAEQYPQGYHRFQQEAEPPEGEDEAVPEPGRPRDYITVGDSWIPVAEDLGSAWQAAFEAAQQLYEQDTVEGNINTAPRDCWPSTNGFRNILYKAGRYEGPEAVRHLDRVPEGDPRLFAQIEMIAALAGLPQVGYTTIGPRRNPAGSGMTCGIPSPAVLEQMLGPELPGIRCPKCKGVPRKKMLWSCKCGHRWNTFDTRGLCPGCGYQWEITGCFQCGEMSPHGDWYFSQ